MIEFRETGWKAIAENFALDPIHADAHCSPLVWVPPGETVNPGVRVLVVATLTQRGRKTVRLYPLYNAPTVQFLTAFHLYSPDDKRLRRWGTHVLLEVPQFTLCRPIGAVMRRAVALLEAPEAKEHQVLSALQALIKHAWICGALTNEQFQRLAQAANGEKPAALRKALEACLRALAPRLDTEELLPEQRIFARFARLVVEQEPVGRLGIDPDEILGRFSKLEF